jgi:hypothetical protein
MKWITRLCLCLVFGLCVHPGWASDACSNRAIVAFADVDVSDGSSFRIESYFQSARSAAIKHFQEDTQVIAVEGPLAWISRGDQSQVGGDPLAGFALGHQFHAMLLYFDEIATDITDVTDISFNGKVSEGMGGSFLYGGKIYMVKAAGNQHPDGMVMLLPEQASMEISFSEWTTQEETPLPLRVLINDGKLMFDYRYTRIDLTERPPNWFPDTITAPDIDEVQSYRLQQSLLAARCEGNA